MRLDARRSLTRSGSSVARGRLAAATATQNAIVVLYSRVVLYGTQFNSPPPYPTARRTAPHTHSRFMVEAVYRRNDTCNTHASRCATRIVLNAREREHTQNAAVLDEQYCSTWRQALVHVVGLIDLCHTMRPREGAREVLERSQLDIVWRKCVGMY